MGLFDRLLGGNKPVSVTGAAKPAKKQEEAFFLDADASSSMGNVEFMRRSNTIRHTFPGTASSPGDKELVEEVASMEMRREKATPGLGGVEEKQEEINLTGGIPKPVKKTFAEQMSKAELDQRMGEGGGTRLWVVSPCDGQSILCVPLSEATTVFAGSS